MNNISFNFVILISGFASRAECHEQLMQPNSIKNLPSLHIYGTNDILVDNDRTLKLAAVFENPIILTHSGGHFTPNTWPNASIRQFLIEQKNRSLEKRNITTSADRFRFEPLTGFEEKLKATILYHQKRISNLSVAERKLNKLTVIPIGLSKSISQENIENIIDNIDNHPIDDVMLLVWCERTIFYHGESNDNNEKHIASSFFRYWILSYLKKSDELLSSHINFIPKYGSWRDLKTLYVFASQMENEFSDEKLLLLNNLKVTCVKMFSHQLKHDHQIVLYQPDECANDKEAEKLIKNHEWISNCAKEAPRLSNNRTKPSTSKYVVDMFSILYDYFCLVMAKDIAKYMFNISNVNNKTEKQITADKVYAYQVYKRMISSVCHVLKNASPTFVNEQLRLRTRKDRAFQYTKEQREQVLNAPPSSYVINPEPEPGKEIFIHSFIFYMVSFQ